MLHWEHIKGFNGSNTGGTVRNIFSVLEWTRNSVNPSDGKITSADMPKLALLNNNPTEGVYQVDSSTGRLQNALKTGISGYNCGSLVATNVINTFNFTNYFQDITYFNGNQEVNSDIYLWDSHRIYFEKYNGTDLSYLSWIYSDNDSDWLEIHGHQGIRFSTKEGGVQRVIAYLGYLDAYPQSLILGPTNIVSSNTIQTGYDLFVGDYVKINNYCQARYFNATSDVRAKENFNKLNEGFLDIIKKVQLYSFNYKNDEPTERTIGLIAQEVQDINIDGFSLVENKNATGEDGDFMMIRESKLIYVLLGAVQELTKEVEELKKRLGE